MEKVRSDNRLIDYISGIEVAATPEEIDAVQVFARQLVEDYGYPKDCIQTHPQFRVKARPSDTKKEYPVDIAVFTHATKQEEQVHILIECKKKSRKDGRTQLENYLTFSHAYLGVWFNGEERFFLRKFVRENGRVEFIEIPNIPKYQQRIEDIGQFRREDLQPTHNLKAIFKSLRNHLAANTVGATRDEVLAQQLINLIFCKLYDEKNTAPHEMVRFRAGVNEKPQEIHQRIVSIFQDVKTNLSDVIDDEDKITLDMKSVVYVVGELQNYSLMESERDVVADAFEMFIGHALKGGQGQFFTPRNVIQMMVEVLQPSEKEKIIDPACGSGGFLIESLKFVWETIEQRGRELRWKPHQIESQKVQIATNNFRGIDKDYFLSKVAKAYMNLVGDGTTGIFCDDSLELPDEWKEETRYKIKPEMFDIVLTNPPFGSNIKVEGNEKLRQFNLAYRWKKSKASGKFSREDLKAKESPQILFIERCLQLLRSGGRMAIVLPDGIFGNETDGYVRNWILHNAKILAIIDIPLETFLPHTGTKTSVLVLQKIPPQEIPQDYPIFMAIAESCGHDRRGKFVPEDDIAEVAKAFHQWRREYGIEFNR